MILLGSVKYSYKFGGITGENHNLFHLGLRANYLFCSLHLISNCARLTVPVFMTIKVSPGAVVPKRALGYYMLVILELLYRLVSM